MKIPGSISFGQREGDWTFWAWLDLPFPLRFPISLSRMPDLA
jgi:hypothetical protein